MKKAVNFRLKNINKKYRLQPSLQFMLFLKYQVKISRSLITFSVAVISMSRNDNENRRLSET
jgi:hypothetical protein